MNSEILFTTALIFFARVTDVSMGTVRTMFVVRGQRGMAWMIGFFEILVWVLAVSRVMENLDYPAYAIAYALGFATGNFVGVTIEQSLAIGDRVVRVFTRLGDEMASRLRKEGFVVTVFEGRGKDGPVELLYIEVRRRQVARVRAVAREVDPSCFYVIDDIREASSATGGIVARADR
jgi:uncharacterized protein YebE (UPF0316 family)